MQKERESSIQVRLMSGGGDASDLMTVRKVMRSDQEWAIRLTPAQLRVGRNASTEPAFCGIFHDHHQIGTYMCAGCGLPLFRSGDKFDSGTGWPSFLRPFAEENLGESQDDSHGMQRTEIHCVRCDMHLGHRFSDGPPPTGQRYCINSVVLGFDEEGSGSREQTLLLGAGCFWGVEEAFSKFPGVLKTEVGYAGGHAKNPTYEDVCSHTTGHAEVLKVTYDPNQVSTQEVLQHFFDIHDPTTLNRQGPDVGDQYRSVIFFTQPGQEGTVRQVMLQQQASRPITTQIDLAPPFYRAEEMHQRYHEKHGGSCRFQ